MKKLVKLWQYVKPQLLALIISILTLGVYVLQLVEAKRSATAAEKRDRANASVVIQNAYKDLDQGANDCVIRSWMADGCKPSQPSTMSDRDRDAWILKLLQWMELVYVQTEALDAHDRLAWREDVQSYFQHPEICKRARARLDGNKRYWEDVFWYAIPADCRGVTSTAAAAKASPSATSFSVPEMKAKMALPARGSNAPMTGSDN
jgi:hypothetical protein